MTVKTCGEAFMIDNLKKYIVFGMLLVFAVAVGFTKSSLFMQASCIIRC